MKNMFTDENLDLWLKNNWNVLLSGAHGVGKTARVIAAAQRAGVKYLYFSTSTMDAWTDFVGVPREKNGVLEYIRPSYMTDDIELIIMDEYNRPGAGGAKVQNAVMELIQFKSINGRRFPKLRAVWAMVNPAGGGYDVMDIDPAQKDRFHIQIEVPFDVDDIYFRNKYGFLGDAAVSWWRQIPDKLRMTYSPRRLEYTLDVYKADCDFSPTLPKGVNALEARKAFEDGDVSKVLDKLLTQPQEEQRKWLYIENNYHMARGLLTTDTKYSSLLGSLPPEKLISVLAKEFESQGTLDEPYRGRPIWSKLLPNAWTILPFMKEVAKKAKPGEGNTSEWEAQNAVWAYTLVTVDNKRAKDFAAGVKRANARDFSVATENYDAYRKDLFDNFADDVSDAVRAGALEAMEKIYKAFHKRHELIRFFVPCMPIMFRHLYKDGNTECRKRFAKTLKELNTVWTPRTDGVPEVTYVA